MLLARAQIASGKEEQGLATGARAGAEPRGRRGTQLEYAMLLRGTGRDEEARAMLTPYATGKKVIPGAVREPGRARPRSRRSRCRERALRGTAVHRRAVLRSAVFPRRDRRAAQGHRARRALLLARDRAAITRWRRSSAWPASRPSRPGLDAGLAHLDEFARVHSRSSGPSVVPRRPACCRAWATRRGRVARARRGARAVPGRHGHAHGARVRL